MNTPWPVEVVHHSGGVHKVTMKPGDIMLYEGASCSHGREEPLDGNWFANVFVHMTPVTKVQWRVFSNLGLRL